MEKGRSVRVRARVEKRVGVGRVGSLGRSLGEKETKICKTPTHRGTFGGRGEPRGGGEESGARGRRDEATSARRE